MTDDREKLAREMMGALAFFENGSVKQVTTGNQCADIAIAYADRRVAEAVTEVERICGEWGCNPKFTLLLTSALSPAREGGDHE